MTCVIYKSLKKPDTYLYIERENDFTRVPEGLLQLLGRLEFVMNLDLTRGRKLAQADANEVRRQLDAQGYYLQMPQKEVTPKVVH
ncbi:MAG: YcgL domain-containing protein [Pseudomonadota bacterium]